LHLVYLVKDVKKSIQPNYRFTLIDIGQVSNNDPFLK